MSTDIAMRPPGDEDEDENEMSTDIKMRPPGGRNIKGEDEKKKSTNIEMQQPGGRNTEDEDKKKKPSGFEDKCDFVCAIVSCGLIPYEIYDIVSDSMTTHKYGQGELSKHYNMFVYITHLVFTVIGSVLSGFKIALQGMNIAIGFCGVSKTTSKAARCVNFTVLLLEALPQAVIAEFYLDVCADKKFYGVLWLFESYVACNIVSSCVSLYSLSSYLWKHRKERNKMNVLCAVGITLGFATLGFSVAALTKDIQVTCLAWKVISTEKPLNFTVNPPSN